MAPTDGDAQRAELAPHPWRARVLAEVHARPFTPVETPRRVLHFGFLTDGEAAHADRAALTRYCEDLGVPGPQPGAKHHRVELAGTTLRWESHSEFSTYTWEFPTQSGPDELAPFLPGVDSLQGVMRSLPQPGPLLVCADLVLARLEEPLRQLEPLFGTGNIAVSEAERGAAIIATDFRPDAFGFVRILVCDQGMTRLQAGSLIQRVLEVETYRTLALLGLPEAQRLAPDIRRIETELPAILSEMQATEGLAANHKLLDRLTALAAELETGAASSQFRFGATRAYHELVGLRLEAIHEAAVGGYSSWSAFMSRRIQPAIRTCVSTQDRQDNLSRKLARAAQLLRTRVDVELEHQNRDLLHAMNERVKIQLRLQQTVEGLSVAAISYYVVGLAGHLLEGLHDWGLPISTSAAYAVLIPVVVVLVWATVRRIRRHHADTH